MLLLVCFSPGSEGIYFYITEMTIGFLPNFEIKVENLVEVAMCLFNILHVSCLHLELSLLEICSLTLSPV